MKLINYYYSFFFSLLCFYPSYLAGENRLGSIVGNMTEQLLLYPQEKIYLHTDKPHYTSGETLFFRAYLLDALLNRPVRASRYIYVELINSQDSVVSRIKLTHRNDLFYGSIPVPKTAPSGNYRLRAYTRYMENQGEEYFFTRFVGITAPAEQNNEKSQPVQTSPAIQIKEEFDVSFYPEGGQLIPGKQSKVAFKALKSNGRHLDVKGRVIDKNKEALTEFNTLHDGMGYFILTPEAGEKYRAVCYSGNDSISFELPEANPNACSIQAQWSNDLLRISLNKAPDAVQEFPLYLIVHSLGLVIHAQEINTDKKVITIDKSLFPSGISHILLLAENGEVISERLVFTLREDRGKAFVQTPQKSYKRREKVNTGICLLDNEGNPLTGSFSIAVTDDKKVAVDTCFNIISYLLLTSELKGSIENPFYYFNQKDKTACLASDLLMMTHGWTRYDIPRVIRGEFTRPQIPVETGNRITGTLSGGLRNKPKKNQAVNLMMPEKNLAMLTQTDKNGRFLFDLDSIDATGSEEIIVTASKSAKQIYLELNIDSAIFPPVKPLIAYPESVISTLPSSKQETAPDTYQNNAPTINLEEVEVTAKQKWGRANLYYPMADISLLSGDMKQFESRGVLRMLSSQPHLWIVGNKVRIGRRSKAPPDLLVDGNLIPLSGSDEDETDRMFSGYLNNFRIDDIAQLDIIQGNVIHPQGIISIFRKEGANRTVDFPYIKAIKPLAVQSPVEFYSPKYDMPGTVESSVPDVRNTIYWQPDVVTDSAGKASIQYYTADNPTTYTLVIEGISDNGKLIRHEEKAFIAVK